MFTPSQASSSKHLPYNFLTSKPESVCRSTVNIEISISCMILKWYILQDFFEWLESGKPERSVPTCWDSELSLCKQTYSLFYHFEPPPSPLPPPNKWYRPRKWLYLTMSSSLWFAANFARSIHQLLVIQALRPDRLLAMGQRVVATILGENFMHDAEQGLDLASVVENEVCIK